MEMKISSDRRTWVRSYRGSGGNFYAIPSHSIGRVGPYSTEAEADCVVAALNQNERVCDAKIDLLQAVQTALSLQSLWKPFLDEDQCTEEQLPLYEMLRQLKASWEKAMERKWGDMSREIPQSN